MTLRNWVTASCTGVVGLIAGLLLAGRPDPGESEHRVQPIVLTRPDNKPATIALEDFRRVVREELAARLTTQGDSGAAASRRTSAVDEAASPPPTREQTAAAEQMQAVLDAAIARRQWTDDDARALRAQFHELSPDQQTELLRQFSVAVNQGRLIPETDQIPF